MAFRLKRDYVVAADPARELPRNAVVTLEAGTKLSDISQHEVAQLAPEHFVADDGSDTLPKDWRDSAALARDDQNVKEREAYLARTSPRKED